MYNIPTLGYFNTVVHQAENTEQDKLLYILEAIKQGLDIE